MTDFEKTVELLETVVAKREKQLNVEFEFWYLPLNLNSVLCQRMAKLFPEKAGTDDMNHLLNLVALHEAINSEVSIARQRAESKGVTFHETQPSWDKFKLPNYRAYTFRSYCRRHRIGRPVYSLVEGLMNNIGWFAHKTKRVASTFIYGSLDSAQFTFDTFTKNFKTILHMAMVVAIVALALIFMKLSRPIDVYMPIDNTHISQVQVEEVGDDKSTHQFDESESLAALIEMGFSYMEASQEKYGMPFAPNESEHQKLTEEMTIRGKSVADFQREHGLPVGDGLSNKILRGLYWEKGK